MKALSEANLIRVLGVGTALILLIIVIVGLDFEVSNCVMVLKSVSIVSKSHFAKKANGTSIDTDVHCSLWRTQCGLMFVLYG